MNINNLEISNISDENRRVFIEKKLFEFNQNQSQSVINCDCLKTDKTTFIEVYAENEQQLLIGGLIAFIDWGRWLQIDTIWIEENYRKQGLGRYLVEFAEEKAKKQGIKRAKLCTFDFQALPFYQKLNYTIYGELEDFPEGHTLYYLKKILLD